MQKEEIYRDYRDKVYGYLLSHVRNPQDAEDMTSDVFVKIYEKLDTFDESKASFSTWVYTVTRNTLTDFFRTRKSFSEIPETLADAGCVEEEVCNAETLAKLADALSLLDKRERDIVILRYYGGKKLKEIAESMGISYAYIKTLQNKAFEKIKKFLQ